MVDELLWSFTAQTVHQLSVIAATAADKFGQLCGPSSGLSRADWGPGRVGDPTLKDCPGKVRSAVWRQEVKADWSATSTLTKDSYLIKRKNISISLNTKKVELMIKTVKN